MKFKSYSCYLVCKEYVNEVKDFLKEFFDFFENEYSSKDWVQFRVGDTKFKINLMFGEEDEMTQNMNFEIGVNSLDELKSLADKYNVVVESFVSTESEQDYTYYYMEIKGPKNICNIVISYCEDVE